MEDIPFPTPEEFEAHLRRYEEKFRNRYTTQDDDYNQTVKLARIKQMVPRIKPLPPPRKRGGSHEDGDSRDRRGGRHYRNRKRQGYGLRPPGRHSPDFRALSERHIFLPSPRTPPGSPTCSETEEIHPNLPYPGVNPPLDDSKQPPMYVEPPPMYVEPPPMYVEPPPMYVEPPPMYAEPPPTHVKEDNRVNYLATKQEPVPHLATITSQKVEEDSLVENFDVSAPAFPSEKEQTGLAPSENDVTAILSNARSSSKVMVSAHNLEQLRKQKQYEDRQKQRSSVQQHEKKLAVPQLSRLSKKHSSSKPQTSAILSESISQKPSAKKRKVTSGHIQEVQRSDEEEIDVEKLDDDQAFDRTGQLRVSIPVPKVSHLRTEPLLPAVDPGSKSHKKSKKRKKEKHHKKDKDRESQPSASVTSSEEGLKLKFKFHS